MTLSSTSRQHRKSMLPTPRLSSRLSARRTTPGETSRIARRVPSPMLAAPTSLTNGSSMHVRVPHPAASRGLPPPDFGTRRACPPSRIPSPSMQPSFPTPGPSEVSSTASTPRTEGGSAEASYPTPPASVETKTERFNGQDGRAKIESGSQPQSTSTRGPPPPARNPSRCRESTALTSFSRTENSTPVDAASHPIAHKKLSMTSSVSGKENRRPPPRTRVLVPAAPAVVVPPRSIQRTAVTHIPCSEASPRPLVIKKKPQQPLEASPAGQDLQAKSAAESVVAPAGIKALIGDLDSFAKEWTGMFDELYAKSENPGSSQADDPGEQPSNSERAKEPPIVGSGQVGEMTPSASAGSVGTIGETVHFDVSAASLVRWQHRDNTMLKNAPTAIPELPSVSNSDSPTDARQSQKEVRRSAPQPSTPRAPRFIPPLPEINQSPIISGPHLVEMTSAVLSNRKDGITKFLEQPPTPTHGIETTRRNATSRQYPPSMAPPSSSPAPISMSLVSVSIPHTSSPLAHQRSPGHDSPPQRTAHFAGDAAPTRSTSLRGLRAIFKRTSAGLTNGPRQRAESLKELIGEPRVLSLGSISISNLRDAGIPGGGVVPAGPMDDAVTSSEVAVKAAAKW
ncbi:hypothetical protein EI94DRAFT_1732495 [Lactarius quietus]|nr:hypothetical protein EI94DRAFT_1732495 [Lactarius quietus]